jgi:hypothetical protein
VAIAGGHFMGYVSLEMVPDHLHRDVPGDLELNLSALYVKSWRHGVEAIHLAIATQER